MSRLDPHQARTVAYDGTEPELVRETELSRSLATAHEALLTVASERDGFMAEAEVWRFRAMRLAILIVTLFGLALGAGLVGLGYYLAR